MDGWIDGLIGCLCTCESSTPKFFVCPHDEVEDMPYVICIVLCNLRFRLNLVVFSVGLLTRLLSFKMRIRLWWQMLCRLCFNFGCLRCRCDDLLVMHVSFSEVGEVMLSRTCPHVHMSHAGV